jgi:Protein of unknown function (DUF4239)
MNSIEVSSIVFTCIFASALMGMAIRRALPADHLSTDGKEVVRLSTALISTMAAMVLGMLVSSAKTSYDARKNDVAEMSSQMVSIDRLLAKYGPETTEIRAQLRQSVEFGIYRIWPKEASLHSELKPADQGEALADKLEQLAPKNERQASIKSQVVSLAAKERDTQWLLFLKSEQTAIPLILLVVLVSWMAAIFTSFGLYAPLNAPVIGALAMSAIAVSAAIFIMLEMYTPFSGVLRISPGPVFEALKQMGR